jgi:hypothetical protein
MMKILKTVTVPRILLVLAACYAAYNFGLAGGYIEKTHFSVGGLIAGVVVNVSIAIAAGNYGSLQGEKRTRQATVALFVMMLLSPLLVAPAIYYSLPVTFLNPVLRALWSIAWPLVADLAIVLAGAVTGKSLIALSAPADKPQPNLVADAPAKSTPAKKRTAPDLRAQCERIADEYACKIPQCAWRPSVDALIAVAQAGKNPKQSANSAHGAHSRHYHYKKVEA